MTGAAIFGAALGSVSLAALEHPSQPAIGGKTIVGGLIGALFMVEWVKRQIGVTRSTGDLFAVPVCVGIAIGRIGCYLAGLADETHGLPTSLPWGHDYGDGVRRHPAQLYEVLFALALIPVLIAFRSRRPAEGDEFKLFMIAYFAWRFCIDFLKPGDPILGITAIQWACALMLLLYYRRDAIRIAKEWRHV